VILFLGWTFFRAVLFPWAFLFLMIPIPALLINRVTFPLQLVAAKWSAGLLDLFGVPVFLEGNLLSLASKQLNVNEACSGIRSLLTLITLAIIYGYLLESRKWVRVVLVCAVIPIAVAANSVRIFGTGLLIQYHYDDLAEGFYHSVTGTVIFAVALIMLFAFHRLICLISKPAPVKSQDITPLQEPLPRTPYPQTRSLRFGIVAAIMLVTAITLQARSSTEIIPPHPSLASFPAQIDGWNGFNDPLGQDELEFLGKPEYLHRFYEVPTQDQPWLNLFVVYFPSQRAGDTIHSPERCLPGAGWIPTSRELIRLQRPDGSFIPVNRYVIVKSSERRLVLYWFLAHGRVISSEWRSKYYLISDSIHMHRSDGGMVRLMTPMLKGESPESAQARMMKLASQIIPLLDTYIPL
jgi:exosortase D (VPLPA-CTERM-specific)